MGRRVEHWPYQDTPPLRGSEIKPSAPRPGLRRVCAAPDCLLPRCNTIPSSAKAVVVREPDARIKQRTIQVLGHHGRASTPFVRRWKADHRSGRRAQRGSGTSVTVFRRKETRLPDFLSECWASLLSEPVLDMQRLASQAGGRDELQHCRQRMSSATKPAREFTPSLE